MRAQPLLPGHDALLQLVRRHAPSRGSIVVIADEALKDALSATHATLEAPSPDDAPPCAIIVCVAPSRFGAPMPVAQALARAAPLAIVAELVWQTAPTPDLARAFAPKPGHDKVRPVEGFEMQVEHAGWRIVERVDVGRDAWLAFLPADDPRRKAIEADDRGAARVAIRVLERAIER